MKKKASLMLAMLMVLGLASTTAFSKYMPLEPIDIEQCINYCTWTGGNPTYCAVLCRDL